MAAGLNRDRILAKARERGLVGPDEELSEDKIYNLIFAPGFSTAEVVSDVSGPRRRHGRGAAQHQRDRRPRAALLDARQGQHGAHPPAADARDPRRPARARRQGDLHGADRLDRRDHADQARAVNSLAGKAELFRLRDEYMPIVRLHELFGIQADHTDLLDGLLMIVEADGKRVGLFVDELMSQQQVVIKSLETNFRAVTALAGATMLGDGRVALILDIPGRDRPLPGQPARRDGAPRRLLERSRRRIAAQQFLTFKLAGEEYGVGILMVQEIRGWSAVTAMPHAPDWMLGVMDLRGEAVPIIDLRRRFALEPAPFGPSTVVIVIRVPDGATQRVVGIVVDAVSEVYDIDTASCRSLPDLGSAAANELVQALAQTDGKTLILLNATRLMASALH